MAGPAGSRSPCLARLPSAQTRVDRHGARRRVRAWGLSTRSCWVTKAVPRQPDPKQRALRDPQPTPRRPGENASVIPQRPKFADYIRVIRRQPSLGLKLGSGLLFFAAAGVTNWRVALAMVAGGVVLCLLWFPVWRHFAPRNPRRWTMGRPENLYRHHPPEG